MSDDFKCPEGWELVPFIQLLDGTGDSYQFSGKSNCHYVVLERKKQQPMPEILPGDAVVLDYSLASWVVYRVYPGHDHDSFHVASGFGAKMMSARCNVKRLYRDGRKYWERER